MSKGAYKIEAYHTTVEDAVSSAFTDFQELRDEMSENASNMEDANTGLATTEKYNRTVEARDALDQFADNEPDVCEAAEGVAVSYGVQVQRRKGRGTSRAVRFANAVAALSAAKDAVETAHELAKQSAIDFTTQADEYEQDADDARGVDGGEKDAAEFDREAVVARDNAANAESDAEALETYRDELENVLGDAEGNVEFPGMYG